MFNIIDIENWERKEHYYHYSNITQCTYSITLKLEVSNIVNSSFKFYPTMIYLIIILKLSHLYTQSIMMILIYFIIIVLKI